MTTIQAFMILITTHFIADFLLQNDWMALGKSKHLTPLLTHVTVYSFFLTLAIIYIGVKQEHMVPELTLQLMVLFNFWAHFCTDFCTSKLNSWLLPKTAERKPDVTRSWHWFFVGIGFDQLLHGFALGATLWFMGFQ